MKNKFSTPVDPPIYYASVIWLLVTWGIWLSFDIYEILNNYPNFKTQTDVIVVNAMMYSMLLAMLFLLPSKAMHRVVFTEKCILYHIPFRRDKSLSYRNYPYIARGYYYHGSVLQIGVDREYIVLSKGKLSTHALETVNTSVHFPSAIKIRYSKQTVKLLAEFLPPKQVAQLTRLRFQEE